jgi:hypothetical protein
MDLLVRIHRNNLYETNHQNRIKKNYLIVKWLTYSKKCSRYISPTHNDVCNSSMNVSVDRGSGWVTSRMNSDDESSGIIDDKRSVLTDKFVREPFIPVFVNFYKIRKNVLFLLILLLTSKLKATVCITWHDRQKLFFFY